MTDRIALDSVELAIAAIARGEAVVVVDDEDRENEGDLIFAGSLTTVELMAFMVRYTSGVVCVPMPGEWLDRLNIPPMTAVNEDAKGTAYTVSVDAREGIAPFGANQSIFTRVKQQGGHTPLWRQLAGARRTSDGLDRRLDAPHRFGESLEDPATDVFRDRPAVEASEVVGDHYIAGAGVPMPRTYLGPAGRLGAGRGHWRLPVAWLRTGVTLALVVLVASLFRSLGGLTAGSARHAA